ncbi:MAG: hypothetical protein Unbinned1693contig1002_12 [Prokaryotic dsDNA virus sp.]|jgi:DNA-binding Lrp family transcriptional regulator|nr:MAG: hypothetical protein Unbinned1693contig1002_12 [Prokaryotic dsDNA virus sp.]|tara:strand:+ start:9705 stop:10064 length:360 start_codon:yes stop_codon:yes gene_type:complete
MSQEKIVKLLKSNPGTFLSIKEIGKILSIRVQTITSAIKKMEKFDEIHTKTITSAGVKGYTKLYGFRIEDKPFEEVLNEFRQYRQQPRFSDISAVTIRDYMIITELRKIKEEMKNEKIK